MASLAKPKGMGDTKKVRRMRKKLEGKAAGGSINNIDLLRQCREVGVCVKPLVTPHLERHGREPTLSAKEARQLILHCASGCPPPKAVEIRNLPAASAVLVLALTGAATSGPAVVTTAAPPPTVGDESGADPPDADNGTTAKNQESSGGVDTANPIRGFSDTFKNKFKMCTRLRISSGGHSSAEAEEGTSGGTKNDGGWLKSLADAFLYAPLGEDEEACPDGPFSSKKKRKGGGGGGGGARKRQRKDERKRRQEEAELAQKMQDSDSERDNIGADEGGHGDINAEDVTATEVDNGGTDEEDLGEVVDGPGAWMKDGGEENGRGEGQSEIKSQDIAPTQVDNVNDDEEDFGEPVDGNVGSMEDEDGDTIDPSPLPAVETYILTTAQLLENGYPLPSAPPRVEGIDSSAKQAEACRPSDLRYSGGFALPSPEEAKDIVQRVPKVGGLDGYVHTQPFLTTVDGDGAIAEGRMFGLDCEMCLTEQGQELTRVTLVDAEHNVLMDELVKPHDPIVDYVTRWSGITPKMLENVHTRLDQVQAVFLRQVGAGDTLVGHSLENDLKALKLVHLRCLDTAVLYPHPKKGRRSSLRYLVSMYLHRIIQGSDQGHNSAEDAIAALELAQLKISKGPNFGAERSTASIFDRLHKKQVPCTMVASSEQCRRHVSGAASAITSFSDDGVVQTVLKELQQVEQNRRTGTKLPLVWAELEGPKCPTPQDVCAAAAAGSSGIRDFIAGVNEAGRSAGHERRILRLLEELPVGVVVFVACQGINPALPRKVDKQRKACKDRRCASVWSTAQGSLLEMLEDRARDGCFFVSVT